MAEPFLIQETTQITKNKEFDKTLKGSPNGTLRKWSFHSIQYSYKLLGVGLSNSLCNPTPYENQWKNHCQCLNSRSVSLAERCRLQCNKPSSIDLFGATLTQNSEHIQIAFQASKVSLISLYKSLRFEVSPTITMTIM